MLKKWWRGIPGRGNMKDEYLKAGKGLECLKVEKAAIVSKA